MSDVRGLDSTKLGLKAGHGQFVTLKIDTTPGRELSVELPINGEQRQIKLAPHSLRAPGFKLLEVAGGVTKEVDPGPVNTLRGSVLKGEGSLAAGGVMPEGLYLAIDLPDGTGGFKRTWLEAVGNRIPGAPAGLHVMYTEDDVRQDGATCGTQEGVHRVGAREDGSPFSPRANTNFIADVALECDFEYFVLYGSSSLVNGRMAIVYNVLNVQYERDVDITHQIGTVIVNATEPDPYAQTTTGGMLDEMRIFWNANRSGIGRDVAHMFTGKPTGGVIGTAYIGVICSSLTGGFGYGVSQTEFNNFNLSSAADLVAHETGHNWNSCHCPCSSPAFTMNPFITSINRFGTTADECSTNSVAAITAHRNSRSCLSTNDPGSDPPLHDACSAAIPIGPGTWAFGNVGATNDGPAACVTVGADVWYSYIAPNDGTVTVSTCGSNDSTGFDSVLAAYTGGCGALTQVTCNDDNTGQCGEALPVRDSYIQFTVTRNTSYLIRLGGFNLVQGTGVINFSITGCTPPANNSCGSATSIVEGAYPFTTVCASTDGSVDNATGCNAFSYFQTGSDIWYRYTASCTGTATASICGADRTYDTRIAIYGASCPTGPNQALVCNDDFCATGSSVTWSTTSGAQYLIRVGGFSGAQGNGTLVVTRNQQLNEACASATPITAPGGADGSTACSTNDGSAACASSATSPDVWYALTNTDCAQFFYADTEGSGYDTALSIHSGCPGTVDNEIACDDDAGTGLLSRVVWQQPSGATYYIRVTGFNNNSGNYHLNVGRLPNDACADSIFVNANTPYGYTNLGATTDGVANGLCNDIAGNQQVNQDVWFTYFSSCAGPTTVSLCGSTYDTKLGVYGDAFVCPPTNVLGCNDDSVECGTRSVVTFNAAAFSYYKIRVGSYQAQAGCGTLTVTPPDCPADIDDGTGTGTRDCGVDINDLLYFLACFEQGGTCADVDDDGADPQLPDGGTDINDLIFFLGHFELGC